MKLHRWTKVLVVCSSMLLKGEVGVPTPYSCNKSPYYFGFKSKWYTWYSAPMFHNDVDRLQPVPLTPQCSTSVTLLLRHPQTHNTQMLTHMHNVLPLCALQTQKNNMNQDGNSTWNASIVMFMWYNLPHLELQNWIKIQTKVSVDIKTNKHWTRTIPEPIQL